MLKEPEITLFGRKISLPENGVAVAGGQSSGEYSNESSIGSGDCDRCLEVSGGREVEEVGREEKQEQRDEEQAAGEVSETSAENEDQNQELSHNTNNALSESDNTMKTPPSDEDVVSKGEDEQTGATNSEQKSLKKPDKILPCPRCSSMDTKFCYYNNYNVNQPRHFCKSCQRYWTAGGTMRNVPVGAGRRKNKNSASHCRHITISEALQAARIDAAAPNGFHNLKFKPNGTVLSFGPDSPLCESMAEKRAATNGYYKIDQVSCKNGEKLQDCSLGSSVTTANPPPTDGGGNTNGFPAPVPCIPWPFPWNNAVPLPAIFPPGYHPLPLPLPMPMPIPYYPAPAPAPAPFWVSVPSQNTAASALGKHSRDGELLHPNTPQGRESQKRKSSESSIVVPKTLRFDDPEEAAKSSIWSTLGIKYDSISREGLFKALQPKSDEKKKAMASTSPLLQLQANPAALSRSLTFQETANS
ncbi:hypothetical protein C2S53_010113 [Perilla frutescens var. hirtella]|uniref:Dof-type domain-containing protein n=1 Tax=Perilla frutescens var. hirtella TaxID=608512 RepID=A0AAD4P893_PERFH|nr:hypothetical protein C2S53_010113 [Perilla frutescens var. hirtella]